MADVETTRSYKQRQYYRARRGGYNVRVRDYLKVVYDPTESLIAGLFLPWHVLAADVAADPCLYEGLCCERRGVVYVARGGELVEVWRQTSHD